MKIFFCRWISVLFFTVVTTAVVHADPPLTFSVLPTNIVWTENTWVDLTVSNLTAGAAAQITCYVDTDQNGVLNTNVDYGFFQTAITDGQTNILGSSVIMDDKDGLANAVIQTKAAYFGVDSVFHVIGSYIWEAVSGSYTAIAAFAVTQPTSTVWISGQVVDVSTNKLGGAAVGLHYFFEHTSYAPTIWTGTNGQFVLYVPENVSTTAVRAVSAQRSGYLSADRDPATGEYLSAYVFPNDLATGNNALPNTLQLLPSLPGTLYNVSGYVYDASTNPVPYTRVDLNSENSEAHSTAFTGTNGFFSLPTHSGYTGTLSSASHLLNLRGLLSAGSNVVVNADVTGANLLCPTATTLARAQVTDRLTGNPIAGAQITFNGAGTGIGSSAFTATNGYYEVGLVGGDYAVETDRGHFEPQGYIAPDPVAGVSIPSFGWSTNLPFQAERGYALSGHVYDRQTNLLTTGIIRTEKGLRGSDTDVDRHGHYEVLCDTNSYRVMAEGFPGYLSQSYSNTYSWNYANPPTYVPVTTAGVSAIDFFLEQASYIRGTVYGTNGAAVPNAKVYAVDTNYYSHYANTPSDANGFYEIALPAGNNYKVAVAGTTNKTFYLPQVYSNKTDTYGGTPINTSVSLPSTNIDFNLWIGGRIEGQVFQTDGTTPIGASGYITGSPNMGLGSSAYSYFQSNGVYCLMVTNGEYRVSASASGWLTMYHPGGYQYQSDSAAIVTVAVGQVQTDINFALQEPSFINGRVLSQGTAVTNGSIQVIYYPDPAGNPYSYTTVGYGYMGSNGSYSAKIPPGTNLLVKTDLQSYFYVDKYWSNVFLQGAATYLQIGKTGTINNLDFEVQRAARLKGRVQNASGSSAVAQLEAFYFDGSIGQWATGAVRDVNGNYTMLVPADTNVVVHAKTNPSMWYPDQYYSNAVGIVAATVINAGRGVDVSNVIFTLRNGWMATGRVYQANGVTPIPGASVIAKDAGTNVCGEARADVNGSYALLLPTNQPFRLLGWASGYQGEYYQNRYDFNQAASFQAAAFAVNKADFALYNATEDHDGDGVPDYLEDTRPDGVFVSSEDWASYTNAHSDADQVTDGQEWIAGTDAQNPNSFFQVIQHRLSGTNVVVEWTSVTGRVYTVQYAVAITNGAAWTNACTVTATETQTAWTNTNTGAQNHHRIQVHQ